jgi:hypothetical protein
MLDVGRSYRALKVKVASGQGKGIKKAQHGFTRDVRNKKSGRCLPRVLNGEVSNGFAEAEPRRRIRGVVKIPVGDCCMRLLHGRAGGDRFRPKPFNCFVF